MPIDPQEDPPIKPGRPTEPPQESPPGSPRPEIPPPVREPGAPPRPEELPGRAPEELPVRGPEGPRTPNPATDAGTGDLPGPQPDANQATPDLPRQTMQVAVRNECLNTQCTLSPSDVACSEIKAVSPLQAATIRPHAYSLIARPCCQSFPGQSSS